MSITNLHYNGKRCSGGFSLFELMFAIGLLAVTVFALTTLMGTAVKVNAQDAAYTLGTQEAQRELERIKTSVRTANDFLALSSAPKAFVSYDNRFIYEVTVEEDTSSLKYVAVTVYRSKTAGSNPAGAEESAGDKVIKIGTYMMRP